MTAPAIVRHIYDALDNLSDQGGQASNQAIRDAILSVSAFNVTAGISNTYQMVKTDGLMRCDPTGGAFALTLLPSSSFPIGTEIIIKNISASVNAITVTRSGASDLIDGATTAVINTARGKLRLVANGAGWDIVG